MQIDWRNLFRTRNRSAELEDLHAFCVFVSRENNWLHSPPLVRSEKRDEAAEDVADSLVDAVDAAAAAAVVELEVQVVAVVATNRTGP